MSYLNTTDQTRRSINKQMRFGWDSADRSLGNAFVFSGLSQCDVVNLQIASISWTDVVSCFQIVVEMDRWLVESQSDAIVLPNVSKIKDAFGRSATAQLFRLSDGSQNAIGRFFSKNWAAQNDDAASAGIRAKSILGGAGKIANIFQRDWIDQQVSTRQNNSSASGTDCKTVFSPNVFWTRCSFWVASDCHVSSFGSINVWF